MHARATPAPGDTRLPRFPHGRRAAKAAAIGVAVVGVVGVGVSVALAGGRLDGGSSGTGSRVIALGAGGAIAFVPASARGPAVRLAGETLEGERVDVAAFRGAPVVLNLWESSCAPCRSEAPDLQAAYLELKGSGVGFIGIDHRDDDRAQARAFQRSFGITYPSIADTDGRALLALRGAVAPTATPTTLVLDTEGRVAARVTGVVDRTTLVSLVGDVRAGRTPPADPTS